jgi:hypothetical protein
MKKISILTLLALFAATLTQQGAVRAQEDFGQKATTTSAWTHITAGSTTGFELADDYYYVSENLTFTNTLDGAGQGSGMYVQAGKTVHLYIPKGVTLTVKGADAYGTQGAGAGILLPEGSTLYILGEGTLVARGGNAANGAAGENGRPAFVDGDSWEAFFLGDQNYPGVGGWGGHGGGGAGAGIGTAGGNGGAGGTQIADNDENRPHGGDDEDVPGVPGNPGTDGTTATAMGTINFQSSITTDISGGAAGVGGAPGMPGNGDSHGGDLVIEDIEIEFVMGIPIPVPQMDITNMVAAAGGGGGGGGAGGGSAEAIGTGGAGGGGGGSGACGNVVTHDSWLNDDHGTAGAGGGKGGVGVNGNNGKDGYYVYLEGTQSLFDDTDDIKDGGTGGAAGAASVAVLAGAATAPHYTVAYYAPADTPSKTSEDYNVGSSTTITLPTLADAKYKWVLSIHGHAAGNTTSHCAAPNGDVYDPGQEVDLSNIYGAIEFFAVYVGCEIDCSSNIDNWVSTAWASYMAGPYAVVKLHNRKLYRDGYWNTLTLPFGLSAEKLAKTCLAGADIRFFKNASWDADNERLTINFSDSNEGKIEAGVPCIIRWGTPATAPGDVIEDQLFENVEVALTDQSDLNDTYEYNTYETESNGLRYQAQIAPVKISANSRTLLLGANNKLYKPNDQFWVYATRAYFTYTSGSGIAMAREITLDFGNGEEMTTRIDDIMVDTDRHTIDLDGIFNLNGQRLDAPQKGINIINGRKVVIK